MFQMHFSVPKVHSDMQEMLCPVIYLTSSSIFCMGYFNAWNLTSISFSAMTKAQTLRFLPGNSSNAVDSLWFLCEHGFALLMESCLHELVTYVGWKGRGGSRVEHVAEMLSKMQSAVVLPSSEFSGTAWGTVFTFWSNLYFCGFFFFLRFWFASHGGESSLKIVLHSHETLLMWFESLVSEAVSVFCEPSIPHPSSSKQLSPGLTVDVP